jgi:hypothetical protein
VPHARGRRWLARAVWLLHLGGEQDTTWHGAESDVRYAKLALIIPIIAVVHWLCADTRASCSVLPNPTALEVCGKHGEPLVSHLRHEPIALHDQERLPSAGFFFADVAGVSGVVGDVGVAGAVGVATVAGVAGALRVVVGGAFSRGGFGVGCCCASFCAGFCGGAGCAGDCSGAASDGCCMAVAICSQLACARAAS